MAYSSKWEMTILEIQTRDIHTHIHTGFTVDGDGKMSGEGLP